MKFVLRMALRETRAGWRRLLFYFLCVAVGVGSIVLLRSAIRNFYDVMASDARSILAADLQIDASRAFTPEMLRTIERLAQPPLITGMVHTIEAATMLRPADPAKGGALMVDLKGVEAPYPFYGKIQLAGGRPFSTDLLKDNGILVARPVLDRLELKDGDGVKIGDLTFTIRGIIEREPGTGLGFRYGPRVLIDRAKIEEAGLAGFGARARRRILLRAPNADPETLVKRFRRELNSNLVRVRSFQDSQENINEQYDRAENFLALTGLVILVLGGIGIFSVTRVFIEQKRKTIAVLKCLGATGLRVTSAYLTQILTLGVSGSLLGVVLAKAGMMIIDSIYAENLPPGMSFHLQTGAVLQGLGVGLLVTLLFSALPLLRVRHIKPNVLLRDESQTAKGPVDWTRWIMAATVSVGLVLLSAWQAGSWKTGTIFLASLLIGAGVLYGAAVVLTRFLRSMKSGISSFPLRHAISSLHRPGNQTRVILMGVGLGVFFIIATQSMKTNLLRELDFERGGKMPNLYLIDIQSDQQEGVREIIEQDAGEKAVLVPTVRARIFSIDGRTVNFDDEDAKKDRGRLAFEYTTTYRSTLQENETLLEGKFWDPTPSTEAEISIEESMRGMMGLGVGSSMTWDIAGRKITCKVTSIRKVDWRNSRTGFYVVFRPGVLEKAPQMFIAALDGPTSDMDRSRFQRKLVDRYPNVTVIDVIDILEGVKKLVRNMTVAVSFIGGFVFFSGALILVGSIAMTKFQRIYESAVLKTLGARHRMLLKILMLEYGLLGTVAGLIGSFFGMVLAWLISKYVFEISWTYSPMLHAGGVVATTLMVVAAGAISSYDILNRKPLGILRTE